MILRTIAIGFAVVLSLAAGQGALAQTVIQVPTVDKTGCSETDSIIWKGLECCRERGDCAIGDFIRLGVNLTDFILGIVGSLALLMFVYGGFTWILSAGSSTRIDQGKTILKNAVLGMGLVFSSWFIIHLVISALMCGGAAQCQTTIFGTPWYQTPSDSPSANSAPDIRTVTQ